MNNLIQSRKITPEEPCPVVEGRRRIQTQFGGYLQDESRTAARTVRGIFLPHNLAQAADAIRQCRRRGWQLSIAGARTGIVGGAVPLEADAVLGLEKLNRIYSLNYHIPGDHFSARVGAGVVLSEFQEALRTTRPHELPWEDERTAAAAERRIKDAGQRLFYPVDPTETSAQIGGTIATNASGARSFYYGPTRKWVQGLTVVLSCGEVVELQRGRCVASEDDGAFVLETSDGQQRRIPLTHLELPDTKHQAGYHLAPDRQEAGIDAVDLFIGSEGTLGIIVAAELKLTFPPAERLFATAFLPDESSAVNVVRALRTQTRNSDGAPKAVAMEYIGPGALKMLRGKRREEGATSGVPILPDKAGCALYLELAFDGNQEFDETYTGLRRLLQKNGTAPERTWAGLWPGEMDAMKKFRHAVPEHINAIIGRRKRDVPELHKVGTDMAVPDEHLPDVLELYRNRLEESGLEYVIFGHIADNHLHVNILPRTDDEVEQAMELYRQFAEEVVNMNGSVSAEHGIGRMKKAFLHIQFDNRELEAMKQVKDSLDPQGMLNPGVIY
ncbi:MAG: FAD-binding oxidoreductase [Planctomycetota bacterium]